MWNNEYLNKIIERANKRINAQNQKMLEVKAGRQMPEEDQVTIGGGRQMEVAVLFLDICSYTSWFNDNYESQKIILAVMNIFMAEMMNIVRDYGGDFEKNTGDGLMAYFGTDENDPTKCSLSAINAALTMHYFNDNLLTPYLIKYGARKTIKFRIGIDYGKVTIAKVGVPGSGWNTFVAIGTTANIANKLLKIASEGDIIIGEHVKSCLPAYEQKYCNLMFQRSGFVYIVNNAPYWAYKYTARWKHPQIST